MLFFMFYKQIIMYNAVVKEPKIEEYLKISELLNSSDRIYTTIYNEEEFKQIWLLNETPDSLAKMSKLRRYLCYYVDNEIVWFLSYKKLEVSSIWMNMFYIITTAQWKWYWKDFLGKFETIVYKDLVTSIAFETHKKADWAVRFYLKQWYKIADTWKQIEILWKLWFSVNHIFYKQLKNT